jgi:hypothetical protein
MINKKVLFILILGRKRRFKKRNKIYGCKNQGNLQSI